MNEASVNFAGQLVDDWASGRVTTATWVNHHGALEYLAAGTDALARLDYVGVDGLLLMWLLGRTSHERTSADLVSPLLLPRLTGARVALIGSDRPSIDRAAKVVAENLLAPGATLVDARDGYAERPEGADLRAWVRSYRPDVVIIGLGTVLQEQWALDVSEVLPAGLVLTCGGYFDQVHQAHYYPSWAYALRLNWAVRLAREPGRLWRRYSVEALEAIRVRERLRTVIGSLPGHAAYRRAVAGLPAPAAALHEVTKKRCREIDTGLGPTPRRGPGPLPEALAGAQRPSFGVAATRFGRPAAPRGPRVRRS